MKPISLKMASVFVVAVALLTAGYVAVITSGGDRLELGDVRPALQKLPYEFKLRRIKGPPGNTASFVGQAHGPHDTTLEFSIGVGSPPHAIPVPGAGTEYLEWFEEMGFVFNDDDAVAEKFNTGAQSREVADMATEVIESLCRVATGEPCPL